MHAPNHLIVSPTIVRRSATQWLMWSVNSGTHRLRWRVDDGGAAPIQRTACTGRTPQTVSLSEPDGFAWHIDVEWIPSRNEYWAIYPVKVAGGCTTDRLRFATSADGAALDVLSVAPAPARRER